MFLSANDTKYKVKTDHPYGTGNVLYRGQVYPGKEENGSVFLLVGDIVVKVPKDKVCSSCASGCGCGK